MHYIMQEISEWCCIYFVFFYAFMQMLLLNIISAIIVELANAILIDENEAKQRDREVNLFLLLMFFLLILTLYLWLTADS